MFDKFTSSAGYLLRAKGGQSSEAQEILFGIQTLGSEELLKSRTPLMADNLHAFHQAESSPPSDGAHAMSLFTFRVPIFSSKRSDTGEFIRYLTASTLVEYV
mmetsp:Transcript_18835/g.27232  ORF Transcript_18835/g.27232 Transcript_18835/m.27232 type:complete len:102 (-) Transcript_18835:605-910(-)